jgi:hypothetical protein
MRMDSIGNLNAKAECDISKTSNQCVVATGPGFQEATGVGSSRTKKRKMRRQKASSRFAYERSKLLALKPRPHIVTIKPSPPPGLEDLCGPNAYVDRKLEDLWQQIASLQWNIVELSGDWGPYQSSQMEWCALQTELGPLPPPRVTSRLELFGPMRQCFTQQFELARRG